jgi:hypothetical protein
MYGAFALTKVTSLEEEVRQLKKKIKNLEETVKSLASYKCPHEMKY